MNCLDFIFGNPPIDFCCMHQNVNEEPDKPVMAFRLRLLVCRYFLLHPVGEAPEKRDEDKDSGQPGIYQCTKKGY